MVWSERKHKTYKIKRHKNSDINVIIFPQASEFVSGQAPAKTHAQSINIGGACMSLLPFMLLVLIDGFEDENI